MVGVPLLQGMDPGMKYEELLNMMKMFSLVWGTLQELALELCIVMVEVKMEEELEVHVVTASIC